MDVDAVVRLEARLVRIADNGAAATAGGRWRRRRRGTAWIAGCTSASVSVSGPITAWAFYRVDWINEKVWVAKEFNIKRNAVSDGIVIVFQLYSGFNDDATKIIFSGASWPVPQTNFLPDLVWCVV